MKVTSTDSGIEIAVTRVERTDTQEEQDDDDGEEQPEKALDREVLDRLLDEGRLAEHGGELDAVQLVGEVCDRGVDRVGDADDVGILGCRHHDRERIDAIGARDGCRLLSDLIDGCHVAEQDDLSGLRARRERDFTQRVEGGDRFAALDGHENAVLGDAAQRERHAVGLEGARDRGGRQARGRHRGRIRGDHHAIALATRHGDIAHAVDGGERRNDDVFHLSRQGRQVVAFGCCGEEDDRDRRGRARNHLRLGALGEGVLKSRQSIADRRGERLRIGSVGVRDRDAREAARAGRNHRLDAVEVAQCGGDRHTHLLVHDLGTAAGDHGDDLRLRQLDRRNQLLLELGHENTPKPAMISVNRAISARLARLNLGKTEHLGHRISCGRVRVNLLSLRQSLASSELYS